MHTFGYPSNPSFWNYVYLPSRFPIMFIPINNKKHIRQGQTILFVLDVYPLFC